ncbi:MAG: oligosaccharide flippase family protein [Aliarcobacter cryaerophilus]|nr:oligosaccharide flippase family protein [Aliarcobacter cryaerophilus]
MSKKLIKNSIIYTIGDFTVVAISGFLLLPFYTRALTQADYGLFNIINASIAILTFLVHFGMISTYSRLYFNQKTEDEKKLFTGQVILLHFLISLVLIILIYIFRETIQNSLLQKVDNTIYFYYIFIMGFFSFISSLYAIVLRINEEAGNFLAFQLSQVGLYVLFIFVFREFTENTLDAILIASFLSAIIVWIYAILKLNFIFKLNNFISIIKKILHFALPIFVGYVMYFALNRFNVLYLQYHESLENIALFSFALQLSMVLTIFAGSFGKAVQPMIFKLERNEVLEKSKKIALYYKLVLTFILIMFYLLADNIISLFAPESYSESKEVFLLLLIGVYIYNLRSVESYLFMYFHKPRYGLYIVTISAFVILILSYIIVDRYGYIGSGYAILIGSFIAYLSNKYYSYKLIKMEYK